MGARAPPLNPPLVQSKSLWFGNLRYSASYVIIPVPTREWIFLATDILFWWNSPLIRERIWEILNLGFCLFAFTLSIFLDSSDCKSKNEEKFSWCSHLYKDNIDILCVIIRLDVFHVIFKELQRKFSNQRELN